MTAMPLRFTVRDMLWLTLVAAGLQRLAQLLAVMQHTS